MTLRGPDGGPAASGRGRAATATRVLAHRLFHRACRRETEPDLEAALRLVDERLVPAAKARRDVAEAALAFARGAFGEHRPGGRLEGELRENVRVGLRRRDGSARVVLIPSLILDRDRAGASVLTMQECDAEAAERRVHRYRQAARVLFRGPVRAFVVRPEGVLDELDPDPGPSRSAPRGEAYPDSGCSPSGHPQSGRRPR